MEIYDLIKLSKKEISEILAHKNNYYLSYALRKKNGKPRWIDAPQSKLKRAQMNILHHILYKFKPHSAATGFIVGRSVKDGAQAHLGNKALLCMDLHNYFNNIKLNRIHQLTHFLLRRLEEQDSKFKCDVGDSTILAELLSFKKQLPQGAPTSPATANLITLTMDSTLQQYCVNNDITYTRYADDLAFSHPDKTFDFYTVIGEIIDIITHNGFLINKKKTRVMRPHKRMAVTGIVINDKLGVPKWKWRNFRAKLHNLHSNNTPITLNEYQELRGYAEWIKTLHQKRGNQFLTTLGKLTLKTY